MSFVYFVALLPLIYVIGIIAFPFLILFGLAEKKKFFTFICVMNLGCCFSVLANVGAFFSCDLVYYNIAFIYTAIIARWLLQIPPMNSPLFVSRKVATISVFEIIGVAGSFGLFLLTRALFSEKH